MTNSTNKPTRRLKNDIILIVALFLIAALGMVYLFMFRKSGDTVRVTVDFEAAKKIEDISGLKMPKQLSELSEKDPRFTNVCEREDMAGFVLSTVGGDC